MTLSAGLLIFVITRGTASIWIRLAHIGRPKKFPAYMLDQTNQTLQSTPVQHLYPAAYITNSKNRMLSDKNLVTQKEVMFAVAFSR
jgi:hypothetical protein